MGSEALSKYKEAAGGFDIILMDISMPVMDGIESTREIRKYEREIRSEPARIIALTGVASESARDDAFASGVNDFLPKPVKFNHLLAFLKAK